VEDIIANFNEFQTETHHLFTGFWSVYDCTDRDNLIMAMEVMHIPQKLISLVRATMSQTHCQIRIRNKLSSSIITWNGGRLAGFPSMPTV
jgi:hypothetical protein